MTWNLEKNYGENCLKKSLVNLWKNIRKTSGYVLVKFSRFRAKFWERINFEKRFFPPFFDIWIEERGERFCYTTDIRNFKIGSFSEFKNQFTDTPRLLRFFFPLRSHKFQTRKTKQSEAFLGGQRGEGGLGLRE